MVLGRRGGRLNHGDLLGLVTGESTTAEVAYDSTQFADTNSDVPFVPPVFSRPVRAWGLGRLYCLLGQSTSTMSSHLASPTSRVSPYQLDP